MERVVVRGEKRDARSGILPERCMVMIHMRSTIGGCGRSER